MSRIGTPMQGFRDRERKAVPAERIAFYRDRSTELAAEDAIEALSAAAVAQTAAAGASTAVGQLADGTTSFTALKVGVQNVKPFLDRTDGSAVVVAAAVPGAVIEAQVRGSVSGAAPLSYSAVTGAFGWAGAKSDVGLGSVDNTADTAKPVSTAQQTALNLKANLAGPTFTGTVGGITAGMVGLGSVENKSSATIRGELTSGNVTTALGYTPTSVTGLTGVQAVAAFKTGLLLVKGDVGLGSVDNTSDAGKPVSTATSTALGLKADATNPSLVVPTYADNAAAVAGGLAVTRIYKTAAGEVRVVV